LTESNGNMLFISSLKWSIMHTHTCYTFTRSIKMYKWRHSKCYSYYEQNAMHLHAHACVHACAHTHTPLSIIKWVYINQALTPCINAWQYLSATHPL
jgi:hypothetical protein